MTSIEIFETGRTAEIPSSWDEMTPTQICRVFQMFEECVASGKSPLEFNVRVLYYFLGLEVNAWEIGAAAADRESFIKRDENIFRLCDGCLGFLFDGDTHHLAFSSVRNPLPEVNVGFTRLIGPGDMLHNLTFGEFRHASSALNSFFRSHDENDLDECIAFLYRRASLRENRAGRRVCPVSSGKFDNDIRVVSGMASWQKNLIMMWFAACLKYLQEEKISIDGELIDMRLLFSGDGESSGPSFGWNDLLVEIAKEQSLGTMEQVEEQPLFTIISIMWHNYKERKRYEQNVKNHKTR